jgi:hypothetical protein
MSRRLNENHFQHGGPCRIVGRDDTRTDSAPCVDIASGTNDIGAMPYQAAVHPRHLHGLRGRRGTPTSADASKRGPPLPAWHVGHDGMLTWTISLRDSAAPRRRDAFAATLLDRTRPHRARAMARTDHRLGGCTPSLRMDHAGRLGLPRAADPPSHGSDPATVQHPKLTVRRPSHGYA